MNQPEVILVTESDEAIGTMEKMEAHRKGLLHRAFSVFILNDAGDILLQQRALGKYHSPGLWTNACCSHPFPGETTLDAAHRRLMEEMGFDCPLEEIFAFTYRTAFDNGLIEHEYDHVLIGIYNGTIQPDSLEVNDYRYMPAHQVLESMEQEPDRFTIWFQLAFPKVLEHLNRPVATTGM
ncbi:isopentenyl-diphosphate Delta-isomerase [Chitinophaga qingshengii]|uniref:Isopentenyl-diphosphate delta-isomerase n=1 Tax=Chitinophaga qingshengii TaxID=1569794 RepID=A0ABR7TV41_9BACT|nr:isopentenyl-diphosphate Delta-isomerase [Chitinophaga qingshengii]MBC9934356.1 isopentenyl-diphosphate Delta-isomerase [Chitinophaga qingshengii]